MQAHPCTNRIRWVGDPYNAMSNPTMAPEDAPFHAHVYCGAATRGAALAVQERLRQALAKREIAGMRFVGELRERPVGPHPLPQFEVHFMQSALPQIMPVLQSAALTVLVHPLTLDDLADHTTLAQWIGPPLPLDLSVLDPPGVNQGVARFGVTDL
jgi:DOPA 4,5-dioxygenase